MPKKSELIVALDVDHLGEAEDIVKKLIAVVDIFKVGSQLFTMYGPTAVKKIMNLGKKVFLDLKYHDIPQTVSYSTSGAVVLSASTNSQISLQQENAPGVFMLTVHTQGGRQMLEAAAKTSREKAEELKVKRPLVIGVTVLTSDERIENIKDIVLQRSRLAKESGLDGVVASVEEASLIRKEFGEDFIIVTPGIRPTGSQANDQKRIGTPRDAVKAGSNFLVVGRPIIESNNPLKTAQDILQEINS